MSFNGLRITGRQSLMIRMLTLSGPGDLLEGIDDTISSTRVKITKVKSNSSSDEFLFVGGKITKFTSDSKCWFELHMALHLCSLRSRRLFFIYLLLQATVNVGLSYTWRCICVACVADDYFLFIFHSI